MNEQRRLTTILVKASREQLRATNELEKARRRLREAWRGPSPFTRPRRRP